MSRLRKPILGSGGQEWRGVDLLKLIQQGEKKGSGGFGKFTTIAEVWVAAAKEEGIPWLLSAMSNGAELVSAVCSDLRDRSRGLPAASHNTPSAVSLNLALESLSKDGLIERATGSPLLCRLSDKGKKILATLPHLGGTLSPAPPKADNISPASRTTVERPKETVITLANRLFSIPADKQNAFAEVLNTTLKKAKEAGLTFPPLPAGKTLGAKNPSTEAVRQPDVEKLIDSFLLEMQQAGFTLKPFIEPTVLKALEKDVDAQLNRSCQTILGNMLQIQSPNNVRLGQSLDRAAFLANYGEQDKFIPFEERLSIFTRCLEEDGYPVSPSTMSSGYFQQQVYLYLMGKSQILAKAMAPIPGTQQKQAAWSLLRAEAQTPMLEALTQKAQDPTPEPVPQTPPTVPVKSEAKQEPTPPPAPAKKPRKKLRFLMTALLGGILTLGAEHTGLLSPIGIGRKPAATQPAESQAPETVPATQDGKSDKTASAQGKQAEKPDSQTQTGK